MERLLIQQWFDGGGTEAGLSAAYGVDVRHGARYPNLISCKYSMIDVAVLGTGGHPIVRECRGIVLDTADSFRIVSRAFNRFYNADDPLADTIDWSTAKILTKEDGSLILASWYREGWLISSSGSPEASGEVDGWGLSFADYFWQTLDANGYELPDRDPGVTLIFELVGPKNRIVVNHTTSDLILLGARDLRTQVELTPADAASLYMPTARIVKEHPLRTTAEIAKALEALNPMEGEGFVVCDAGFRRQKHKSSAYILMHKLRDGNSPRALMAVALSGDQSEAYNAFPELRAILDDYAVRISDWCLAVDAEYASMPVTTVQKEFALAAVTTKCPGALFQIRAKKCRSARDYLATVHLDHAMSMLGVKTSGG